MRRRRIAVAAASALLVVSCSSGDDDAPPDPPADAVDAPPAEVGPNGFVPDPIEWSDCGGQDCATVTVPIDYADVEGERLTLQVLRQPASGDRIGAIFVNPGGPGASAVEFAAILPLLLPDQITERFDIVGVDPRGVGGTVPLDCGMSPIDLYAVDPTIEDDGDRTELLEVSQTYVEGCTIDGAELLAHIGTRDAARDLDSVRAAMGDPQMSFVGASYGTAIGQVYAELFPERVRAMVLDAVVELGPSGLDIARDQAAGFERALEGFAEDCREDGGCRVGDDPIGAVEEVLALVEQPGGLPAPDATRDAGPGEMSTGLAGALYSPTLWGSLDDALADALEGDGSGIVDLSDQYLGAASFDVYFAVNCLDFAWPTGDPDAFLRAGKEVAAASPHLGEALVTDYVRCAYWPVPAEPLTQVTAPGTPPILVISTTGDPATPYEQGVAVADRLEDGVLLTHEGEGHGTIGSGDGCIDAHLAAYLIDGTVPDDGAVCD